MTGDASGPAAQFAGVSLKCADPEIQDGTQRPINHPAGSSFTGLGRRIVARWSRLHRPLALQCAVQAGLGRCCSRSSSNKSHATALMDAASRACT